jgi:hypothetical protein
LIALQLRSQRSAKKQEATKAKVENRGAKERAAAAVINLKETTAFNH